MPGHELTITALAAAVEEAMRQAPGSADAATTLVRERFGAQLESDRPVRELIKLAGMLKAPPAREEPPLPGAAPVTAMVTTGRRACQLPGDILRALRLKKGNGLRPVRRRVRGPLPSGVLARVQLIPAVRPEAGDMPVHQRAGREHGYVTLNVMQLLPADDRLAYAAGEFAVRLKFSVRPNTGFADLTIVRA